MGGEWIPAFKNAKYILVRPELEYWLSGPKSELVDDIEGVNDSIRPVLDAGLAQEVEPEAVISENIKLINAPGHTPHHTCVLLESKGESILFTGDLFHHPIQIVKTDWMSFDTDESAAYSSRLKILDKFANTNTLIAGAHFSEPWAGKIESTSGVYVFKSVP